MQNLPNNKIQYSLKDLLKFNDSRYESFMDRKNNIKFIERPKKLESKALKWVQDSGNFFEIARVDKYKKDLIKPSFIEFFPQHKELIELLLKNYSINIITSDKSLKALVKAKAENAITKEFISSSKFKKSKEITNEETSEVTNEEYIHQFLIDNVEVVSNELSPFLKNIVDKNFKDFPDLMSKMKEKDPVILEESLIQLAKDTIKAMEEGMLVISQGLLRGDDFMGSPDLMVRITDTKPYKYEIKDIKRSHMPKAKFVLQICAYSDLLGRIQGEVPEEGEILLGNNSSERFKIKDYYNYYLTMKNNFFKFHDEFGETMVELPSKKDLGGDWSITAKQDLFEKIESITNIANDEIVLLKEQGIRSFEDLARSENVLGIAEPTLHRLKKQAFIKEPFELLTQFQGEPGNLFDLPDFEINDIYLDVKTSESLDKDKVLFFYNIYHLDENGQWVHKVIEAYNLAMEEGAFKYFLSYISPILEKNKEEKKFGKIYHFNPKCYNTLIEFASKYHKGYYFLNNLFRNKSFICLQDFLINSVVLNTSEYSLENIAQVLNFELQSLGVGFESPLVSLKAHKKSYYDHEIEDEVNEALEKLALDKMQFFKKIHDWLIGLRTQANIKYVPHEEREEYKIILEKIQARDTEYQEKQVKNEEAKVALDQKIATETKPEKKEKLIAQKMEALKEIELEEEIETRTKKLKEEYIFESKEYDGHDVKKKLMILNLQCQEFNKRERDLKDLETAQLNNGTKSQTMKNLRCITDIKLVSVEQNRTAKSERSHYTLATYSFNLFEDHRMQAKDNVIIKNNPQFGSISIHSIEDNLITLRFGSKDMNEVEKVKTLTIIENRPNLSSGINKFMKEKQAYMDESHATLNLPKCYYDFLTRSFPDINGYVKGEDLYTETDNLTEVAKKLVLNLNNSCLIIQGPPGVGKSYTASHAIKELLKNGKSVIISSNSNKAIDGLLISAAKECKDLGIKFYKHSSEKELNEELSEVGILNCHEKHIEEELGAVYVIGTTVFGAYKYKADYLFVDEAGQVSIANLSVMASVVKNIVLIGDQNQLEQPVQGVHPGESGESALEYYLKNTENSNEAIKVIPKNKGLFLPITRRMNSELCSVVSKYFYEDQLKSIEDVENTKIKTQLDVTDCKIVTKNKGVQFVNVLHFNNPQYSMDEVRKVEEIINDVLGSPLIDEKGDSRVVTKEDIIIVSPFNLQVSKLKKALPDYKIGSVDLFQGQEAPIVIYSLGASEAGGRGLEFLLNPNRTNVALSRGKALAIIVASEAILQASAEKIEELKLLNMFSELILLK